MYHDIDETPVSILVRCPHCNEAIRQDTIRESLEYMTPNSDGTYTDEIECPNCYA